MLCALIKRYAKHGWAHAAKDVIGDAIVKLLMGSDGPHISRFDAKSVDAVNAPFIASEPVRHQLQDKLTATEIDEEHLYDLIRL